MEATKTPRQGALRRAWATLEEAVAGSQQDFTEGSLGRAVVLLAVPMILEMSMESVFGVLDVFFVGRLGPGAVAAVGLTEAMLTIVFAVAMGLSLSTTAMVARRIGEKDPEGASATAVQAIALGLLVAIPSGIVGIVYARELLGLMGAPAAVAAEGAVYTAWILGGNATILLLFLINAIFRGAGDASLAMRSLWLANLVNVVLDPCLIFGLGPFPELGLAGAAIGTTVGRGVGVLYQLRAIAKGPRIVIEPRHLKLQWDVMGRLLQVSAGGIAQFLIATGSWLGLVLILTPFGAGALAGYTIAVRIVVVAILPAWGLCNAAATLVGQNLGAQKPERAERSVWLAGFFNMAFLGVVTIVFVVFADGLVGIFTPDPAVRALGASCLRIFSYGYVIYAWGMVMVQALNGAGDTTTPTFINLVCYWLFQIPLAFLLARTLGFGAAGVFWAVPIAELFIAAAGIAYFRRGTWKTRLV
jgi:putative MATE family efflux protein